MSFNYSKLAGRIKEKFGTQSNFSTSMGLSERSLSQKMNNKKGWKQREILKACILLGVSVSEIPAYFFTE